MTARIGAVIDGPDLDDLLFVLGRLRNQNLSSMSPSELSDGVVELRKLVDWFEVEWSRRVAHLEEKSDAMVTVRPPLGSSIVAE